MGDDPPSPARPATAMAGALLSGAAASAMVGAAQALRPSTPYVLSEDALIAWVLLAVAAIGALFCVYLMVIWGLAAVLMVTGPASRIGAALLFALRALAPQVARRVVVSTALAATATGLALTPATAADRSPGYDAEISAPVAVSSELTPSDLPVPDDESPAEPGDPSSTPAAGDQASESGPLPGLGWGKAPGAVPPSPEGSGTEDTGVDATDTDEASPKALDPRGPGHPEDSEDAGSPAGSQRPQDSEPVEQTDGSRMPSSADAGADLPAQGPPPDRGSSLDPAQSTPGSSTIVVHAGDTLWSITDDLLGPASDSPSEIAASWPLLHEANRDVIGTDPDLLEPGQELLVPTPLSSQEQ